ncbi:MAG: rhodanese-like domain-containing protein [Comamonadaceae bacterium]|nr:MAG: rhodanese-like domain-containing protein [Comamonadaceae bacterium]
MKFILDNWVLILIALSSGAMLAVPVLRGAGQGALTAQGAVQLINREKGVLIDVRDAEEYAAGHPVGARSVPLADLEAKLASVVKNKTVPVLLLCGSGARAKRAVETAKKLGYENAQVIAGGMRGWSDANLPVEKA